jgi:hypothetical protein
MPLGYFDIFLENNDSLGSEDTDTVLLEQGVLVADTGTSTESAPTLTVKGLTSTEAMRSAEITEILIAGPGDILLEEGTVPWGPDYNYAVLREDGFALLIESGVYGVDSGTSTDTVPSLKRTLTDTIVVTEVASPVGLLSSADAGAGIIEIPTPSAIYVQSDTAVGADTPTPRALYQLNDAGTGTNTETLRALYALLESGAIAETQVMTAVLATLENPTGVEASTLQAVLTSLQVGTGTDTLSRLLNIRDFLATYNVVAHARKDLLVQYLVLQMVLDDLYVEYNVKGKHIKPAGIITRLSGVV